MNNINNGLEDSIEQLKNIGYGNKDSNTISKDAVLNMCKETLKLVDDVGYSNDFIEALRSNLDKVESVDITTFFKILGRFPSDNDIVDFYAYKFNISDSAKDNKIIEVLKFPENEDDIRVVGGFTFRWNKRKSAINKIKHGLSLEDAIEIIVSKNKKNYETEGNRIVTFGFINQRIFISVEFILEEGKSFRILSFRRSNQKEWEYYENNRRKI